MVPVVSIVGKSGSGKTTFIERIIPILKAKGYRIGAIKHDAHRFDIDHEGKDTWRMANSGADTVAISSSSKMAMVKKVDEEKSIDELVDSLFKDVDIVITEGYKNQDKPKIEIVRFNEIIASPSEKLIALVDNRVEEEGFSPIDEFGEVNKFKMKDLQPIAEFIEKTFLFGVHTK